MGLGDKLQPLLQRMPLLGHLVAGIGLLKQLWHYPKNPWVPRLYILSAVFLCVFYAFSVWSVVKIYKSDRSVAEKKTESVVEKKMPGPDLLGEVSPFPKSVLAQADGQMEEGHDLIDREALQSGRSLASLLKEDNSLFERSNRFVELDDLISSSAQVPDEPEASVLLSVTLEVNNPAVEQEVKRKKSDIQAVILGLVAEQRPSHLRDIRKVVEFKKELQNQINHLLSEGKVTDVLFTQFNVR